MRSRNEEDHQGFKRARDDYSKKCHEAKSVYYSNEVKECGGDLKRLYKLITKLTQGDKPTPYPESESDASLCDDFAKFFTEKIDKIMNDIEEVVQAECIPAMCQYPPGDTASCQLSSFTPLSTAEVRELINKSKTKSCMLDPIPTALLKLCIDELLHPITDIVNSSLQEGIFPENWKTAIVMPLLKKTGLDLIFKNYRPVSNLSFVSKVTERAGLSQYVDHLKSINMYTSKNSAYKEQHSTETLLVKVHSDIINNMDNRQVTLLVMLDLSAAFDTVCIDILSDIFENRFNITGNVLSWFETYLRNRDQRIIINNAISDRYEVKYGVPQGSCAGPVVFLGYLSSLYDVIERHLPVVRVGGYADDHQVYLAYNPSDASSETHILECLHSCISDVRSWMLSHRLKINDTKTEFMVLGTSQQLAKVKIHEITVGNCAIKPVTSLRNLGVVFDQQLQMADHVNSVCKKGYYQLRRIRQIRKYLDKTAAEEIVHSFVTSHIDYCNALFYNAPKYAINKLQKLQNAAARVILGARKQDHATPLLHELHWLPVTQRIQYKIALLTFKCVTGMAPDYLRDLIQVVVPQRELRSSARTTLKIPRCNTNTGTRAFTWAAPQVWNNLPHDVITAPSINCFKTKLKTFLFKKAFRF